MLSGLVVGSVCTVLGEDPSLAAWVRRRRSRCPSCLAVLAARDLVPLVSAALARGRCRRCGAPVPRWHLATELVAVCVFVLAGVLLGGRPLGEVTLAFALLALLFALTVIDLRHFLLPDPLVAGVAAFGLVRSLALQDPGLSGSLAGGALGLLTLGALAVLPWHSRLRVPGSRFQAALGLGDVKLAGATPLRRGYGGSSVPPRFSSAGTSMGLGDVKLAGAIGVVLGAPGLITALFLAFVAGGAVGAFLLLTKRATLGTRVPFGPFLCGATAAVLLVPALPLAFFRFLGLNVE